MCPPLFPHLHRTTTLRLCATGLIESLGVLARATATPRAPRCHPVLSRLDPRLQEDVGFAAPERPRPRGIG